MNSSPGPQENRPGEASPEPDPPPRTVGRTLFADFLKRNAGRIRRYARGLREGLPRSPGSDTLDDVQDASARFLEKTRHIRSDTHFLGLFRGFVRNALLDRFRRDKAMKRGEGACNNNLSPSEIDSPAGMAGPLTAAIEYDRRERLKEALQRLDRRERQLVHLRVWEDRPWAEIVQELDLVSVDAARMQYKRILERIRAFLPGGADTHHSPR